MLVKEFVHLGNYCWNLFSNAYNSLVYVLIMYPNNKS